MRTVEQRLQALEQQLGRARRTNRVLACLLAAVACGLVGYGATPAAVAQKPIESGAKAGDSSEGAPYPAGGEGLTVVKAGGFELVDPQGRLRAALRATVVGPSLAMFDELGEKRIEVSQTDHGAAIRLFDAAGVAAASLSVESAGDEFDAQLEIRSDQGSLVTRASGVSIRDRNERQRALLALINGVFPVLGINQSGQEGPASVEITAGDDGSRGLTMHNANGFPLLSLDTVEGGASFVSLRHPDHERMLQIEARPDDSDGPRIVFFSPAREDGTGGVLPFLQLGLGRSGLPMFRTVDRSGSATFAAP